MSGIVTSTQSKNVTWRPARSSSMPIAIRFGGDAIGTPTATDDAHVSMSMNPIG